MSLLRLLAASADAVVPPPDPDPDPPYEDPSTIPTAPFNKATPIVMPTPDGTGQATHPDVIDFAGVTESGLWNGHRYWMAFTPYAASNVALENPCIAYSDNGNTWTAPPGVNPLDPYPGGGNYNSDTDMVYDPDTGRVWLYWREVNNDTNQEIIYVSWSVTGTTWSSPETLISISVPGAKERILSPAVVRVATGDWRMWSIRYGVLNEVRTAPAPNGPWSAPTDITFVGLPGPAYPWHVDVIRDATSGKFHMLLNTRNDVGEWALISTDGLTWTTVGSSAFLLSGGSGAWDSLPYRATMQPETNGTVYSVWYSAATEGLTAWGVARTRVPRSLWVP